MPYVGVAFFVWVGIFNISLVAQFWSFANDLYSKESGARLFPIIVIGMTAGAPLGSLVAGAAVPLGSGAGSSSCRSRRCCWRRPPACISLVNAREAAHTPGGARARCPAAAASRWCSRNPYLRLIAALIVLLNVVNTTGEYLVARLLSAEVQELAAANPLFDKQAYIGALHRPAISSGST